MARLPPDAPPSRSSFSDPELKQGMQKSSNQVLPQALPTTTP